MLEESLIKRIRASCIGDNNVVYGPFGARRLTYADYSASGRALSFIEDFITKEVLPMYANTHTEASATALQTTRFREDARAIIKKELEVPDDSSVIFTGSGTTAAINKLVAVLGIRIPEQLDDRYHFSDTIAEDERPVVFIGPYEHHSNELPWRESIADVITIPEGDDGHIDLASFETTLKQYQHRPLRIGSFSAASNVTGIVSDTEAMTALMHKYGALAFWDYAAAGPHIKITVGDKDAIFISPHKFPGGVGTPGILVASNTLLVNRVPSIPGGGTVSWVSNRFQEYLDDATHREEGGTPAIVESIRAGLVFQLKAAVGYTTIHKREDVFLQRCLKAWRNDPNIKVLGNPKAQRLSIVSFLVLRPGNRYLHHNFVVALLNDLYGIQARGGCACAGPYGHQLLDIDETRSDNILKAVRDGYQGGKPGWVRVTFNYFITDFTADYIIKAVQTIGRLGWALLPQYTFNAEDGLWRHRRGPVNGPLRLTDLSYKSGNLRWRSNMRTAPESALQGYARDAEELMARAARDTGSEHFSEGDSAIAESFDTIRWFDMPGTCVVRSPESNTPASMATPPPTETPLPIVLYNPRLSHMRKRLSRSSMHRSSTSTYIDEKLFTETVATEKLVTPNLSQDFHPNVRSKKLLTTLRRTFRIKVHVTE